MPKLALFLVVAVVLRVKYCAYTFRARVIGRSAKRGMLKTSPDEQKYIATRCSRLRPHVAPAYVRGQLLMFGNHGRSANSRKKHYRRLYDTYH